MPKFTPNASGIDRLIRVFLAAALIYLGLVDPGVVGNRLVAYLLGVVGVLNLIVVCIGWCPVYALTGVRTIKKQ